MPVAYELASDTCHGLGVVTCDVSFVIATSALGHGGVESRTLFCTKELRKMTFHVIIKSTEHSHLMHPNSFKVLNDPCTHSRQFVYGTYASDRH